MIVTTIRRPGLTLLAPLFSACSNPGGGGFCHPQIYPLKPIQVKENFVSSFVCSKTIQLAEETGKFTIAFVDVSVFVPQNFEQLS